MLCSPSQASYDMHRSGSTSSFAPLAGASYFGSGSDSPSSAGSSKLDLLEGVEGLDDETEHRVNERARVDVMKIK